VAKVNASDDQAANNAADKTTVTPADLPLPSTIVATTAVAPRAVDAVGTAAQRRKVKKVSPLGSLLRAALRDVTPIRLWLLFALATLGFLCFCIATVVTVKQHMHALDTVGSDAAPSVISAHQIKIAVAAMDDALTDQMMTAPGQRAYGELIDDFEKSRQSVCRELVIAAQNITYGHVEQEPIENMQIALGTFEMQAQQARDLHESGKDVEALAAYRKALTTVGNKILTAADDLNKANSDVLEETYGREKSASALSRGLVLVLGMVLIGLLLYINIFISVRFKRRLNMPLILTMLFLAVFLRYLTSALGESSHGLVVAKEDAYNSVLALLDARSAAYLADSTLSRCLLDSEDVGNQKKFFQANLDRIAILPAGQSGQAVLSTALKQSENGQKVSVSGFGGALADELANIRFEGERMAALDCLTTFLNFRETSNQELNFILAGKRDDALSIGLGYDPHGTHEAFNRFDDAMVRTLQINQEALSRSVKNARHALNGLVGGSIAFCVLMVLSTYLGLRPRIQEYQIESYLHRRDLKKGQN
jgi:CHASE3 domain sensor protein